MIKSLAEKMLRNFGLQIEEVKRPGSLTTSKPTGTNWDDLVARLAKDPMNANLHLKYAITASKAGRPYLAYAELKTAKYLGANQRDTDTLLDGFKRALPDPTSMNHNQYFRFISL